MPSRPEAACPSDVDALLQAVGVSEPERIDCGRYAASEGAEIAAAAGDCLLGRAGDAAELTVDACADCAIRTAYVYVASEQQVTLESPLLALQLEDREASVTACHSLGIDEVGGLSCDGTEIYRCSEPRADAP